MHEEGGPGAGAAHSPLASAMPGPQAQGPALWLLLRNESWERQQALPGAGGSAQDRSGEADLLPSSRRVSGLSDTLMLWLQ